MSIIRAIKHRLGLSVTPANNFVLTAEADNGTMKLARESGQDIMTVDAAGAVAFPANPALPGFRASGSNTSFPRSVATQFANFIGGSFPATIPGWNPTTGEYTVQKTGWYAISFWMSCGQNAVTGINPYLQFFNTSWATFAGSFASSGPSAKSYVSVSISGVQYLVAGQRVRAMALIDWSGAGPYPLTDGASLLNIAYMNP